MPSAGARRSVALALLALCIIVVVWRHVAGGGARAAPALRVSPLPGGATTSRTSRTEAAAGALVVDVVGAVNRQGLVHLPRGARVADAIASAGGLTRHAARSGVNLAAPVVDGEQVVVPRLGAAGASLASPGGGGGAAAVPAGPVSLSVATPEQLDSLPGIGPVTAQKIVAYREQHGPFTSVEGLDAIPGIGPARISELQGLVTP